MPIRSPEHLVVNLVVVNAFSSSTFKEDINIEWVVDCEDPFVGCLVFEVEVKGSGENEDRPRGRSSPTT